MIDRFQDLFSKNLLDVSNSEVLDSFNELSNKEKMNAISYVLSAYGYSSAFEFLLLINEYWMSFSSKEWIYIVELADNDRAKYTMLDFFLMYTSNRSKSFFRNIGIPDKFLGDISLQRKFTNIPAYDKTSRFNEKLYNRLGLSINQVERINSYELPI